MKKKEAIKIILECAQNYANSLENKNIMFIFQDMNKNILFMEAVFLPRNFFHLTGLKLINTNIQSSVDFYDMCLRKQININDFEFSDDGTAKMKLSVLNKLTQIHKTAKMVGDFNLSKLNLYTSRLAGTVTACMGFVCNREGYYIPNTALREDIRDLTLKAQKVIAIFSKQISEIKYQHLTYIAKGIDYSNLKLPKNISNKISLNNLK